MSPRASTIDTIGGPRTGAASSDDDYCEFIRREVAQADFGDRRLTHRLQRVMADFAGKPQESIPASSGNWAATKGAYRLFSNESVTAEKILEPHFKQTVERCRNEEVVLAIGDTTYIDLTGLESVAELGPLASENRYGLVVQPTFVVTPKRVPLGLIDNHVWARDAKEFGKEHRVERCTHVPIEKKESAKWLRSLNAATELQRSLGDGVKVVVVFDREGDIFNVLAKAVALDHKPELLVRALHNRMIEDDEERKLWDFVNAQPCVGDLMLAVARKDKQKARQALLKVRFTEVTLRPPAHRPKDDAPVGPIKIYAVSAEEHDAPEGVTPISWHLLTTIPVDSHDAAERTLSWYACRWTIEQYFKVLKSGCEAEERRLEADERIKNCLAADMIIAWMILYLTTIGRQTPDLPCTVVFDEDAWKAVWIYLNKTTELPAATPTLHEMARMVSRLGGYLARRHDGPPGAKTLWKGLQRVPDLVGMWRILRTSPS